MQKKQKNESRKNDTKNKKKERGDETKKVKMKETWMNNSKKEREWNCSIFYFQIEMDKRIKKILHQLNQTNSSTFPKMNNKILSPYPQPKKNSVSYFMSWLPI